MQLVNVICIHKKHKHSPVRFSTILPFRSLNPLLLAAGLLLAVACENDIKKVESLHKKKDLNVEEAVKIEGYMSQNGSMRSKLTAPLMLRYEDTVPRLEFIKGLHVDFFNDSLKTSSILDARYGIYYETRNKVYLRDSVRVEKFETRDTFYFQDLYWDQNKKKFYTSLPVRIHQHDKTIFGKGMEASEDFSEITLDTIYGTALVNSSQLPQ